MAAVVVGVDGSEPARAALEFAAHEAGLRGARLRIVSAWEPPPVLYAGGFAPAFDQATINSFREGAEKIVKDARDAVRELETDTDGPNFLLLQWCFLTRKTPLIPRYLVAWLNELRVNEVLFQ